MSWTSFRRRGEVLRDVIAAADMRRDGKLPLDVEGVDHAFADEIDLLGALHLRWYTRLSGRIERELLDRPDDRDGAVIDAWHRTADELPGVRSVIDHYRYAPKNHRMETMLDTAVGKEHLLLAVMSGRASAFEYEGSARTVGARIELAARTSYRPAAAAGRRARPTMFGRLRAALVA